MATLTDIKTWLAKEYTQATQEVHNFISWVEQKDNQIESAKAVLEANGYTVTPKTAVAAAAPTTAQV